VKNSKTKIRIKPDTENKSKGYKKLTMKTKNNLRNKDENKNKIENKN